MPHCWLLIVPGRKAVELMITNGLVPDDGVLEESPTAADHNDNNKYNTNFNHRYNGNENNNDGADDTTAVKEEL